MASSFTVSKTTGSWLGTDDGSHPKSHEGLRINFLGCIDVKAEIKEDSSEEEEKESQMEGSCEPVAHRRILINVPAQSVQPLHQVKSDAGRRVFKDISGLFTSILNQTIKDEP